MINNFSYPFSHDGDFPVHQNSRFPFVKNIFIHLVTHHFRQEWKQRHAFFGMVLYCAATIFIAYLAFRNSIDAVTWNALFWIIMLFASVNALAKSFLSESRGRQLYYYSLVSAPVFYLSKLFTELF
jgi:heme exporter protein B